MNIRRSRKADAAQIAEIMFLNGNRDPDAAPFTAARYKGRRCYVWENERGISGYIAAAAFGGLVEIEDIGVHPSTWRRSIGRSLVEHLAKRARADLFVFLLSDNLDAYDFFTSCGFQFFNAFELDGSVMAELVRPGG